MPRYIYAEIKVSLLDLLNWHLLRHVFFIVFPLYGTLFPTAGFSHRVYHRGFNEAIGTICFFIFILLWRSFMAFFLYGVPLCRSVLLAAAERSKRGSVAISHSFCFVTPPPKGCGIDIWVEMVDGRFNDTLSCQATEASLYTCSSPMSTVPSFTATSASGALAGSRPHPYGLRLSAWTPPPMHWRSA